LHLLSDITLAKFNINSLNIDINRAWYLVEKAMSWCLLLGFVLLLSAISSNYGYATAQSASVSTAMPKMALANRAQANLQSTNNKQELLRHTPSQHIEHYRQCTAKLANIESDSFTRAKVFAQMAQNNLHIIYQDNAVYRDDYREPGNKLADGKLGRITRQWLSYFCHEFLLATDNTNDQFIDQLLSSLITITQLSHAYNDWRLTIESAGFIDWLRLRHGQKNNEQAMTCHHLPGCLGSATQLHQLLDSYHIQIDISHAKIGELPSYYQITDNDITYFKAINEILADFEALLEQKFDDKTSLNVLLTPLLNKISQDIQYHLDNLVKEYQVMPVKADEKGGRSYQLSRQGLGVMLKNLGLSTLSDDNLTSMQQLQGRVFAQQYLLDVALTQFGINELSELKKSFIMRQAYKVGQGNNIVSDAIVWQASEGCGCADNLTDTGEPKPSYYGFYPYWFDKKWLAKQQNNRIDFSRLNRIGYFSATVTERPSGINHLETPYNWQASKHYAQFVDVAHQHRVNVDLVISNRRSSSKPWRKINHDYGSTLISQIVKAVKLPMDDFAINRLKPLLSFGSSPSRTMADGVTLNFELSQLTDQTQQANFHDFTRLLKQHLLADTQTDINRVVDTDIASLTDRYYLNMMVPVTQLIEEDGQGFYNFENLLRIEPYVNSFIMVFEPLTTQQAKSTNGRKTKISRVQNMKNLRTWLGNKKHINRAQRLFKKMIPMLETANPAPSLNVLSNAINYTSWSYLGAAYWTLPINQQTAKKINDIYFPTAQTTNNAQMTNLTTQISYYNVTLCNYLCPQRWMLRLAMFLLFTLVIFYAMLSFWLYQLRVVFNSKYFLMFSALVAILIFLVFSCDPYWKRYQLVLFMVFSAVAIAIGLLLKRGKDRASKYP